MSPESDEQPGKASPEPPQTEGVPPVAPVSIEDQRDEDLDNQMIDPERIIEANPQWGGAATLAGAASFDAVVPGAMADARANQFRAVEMHGEFSLSNGGGSLETTFEQMFGIVDENGRKKDDEDDGWDEYVDAHERREEAKREMEERWASEEHTFAGQTMTGAEWAAMKKWFDDPAKVAGWEQAMMAETGQSLAEVRRTGGKMKRFYELIDKQAQGTALTTQEKAEFQTLNNDQDVRQGVEVARQQMEADRAPSTRAEVEAQTTDERSNSSSVRSDLIAARANLNADPLTPTYNAAATDRATPTPDGAPLQPNASPATVAPAATPPRVIAAINSNLDMG